ncbi:MAG: CDP-alcohol phosphatidyltransferase family protein [Dongiaceae bacterium]
MTDPPHAIDPAPETSDGPKTAILVNRSSVRLWNLTQEERLRRAFGRCGIDDVGTEIDPPPATGGDVILARTDFAIDDTLVRALVRTPGCMLVAPVADNGRAAVAAHVRSDRAPQVMDLLRQLRSTQDDLAAAGPAVLSPAQLGSSYNHALRKRTVPFVMSLIDNPPIAVERQMFRASYKGVTDFVTKWLWPWPAFWATRWCAARGISPNLVTAASLVLVLLAMWLFARNYFTLGLVAAWLMTFLDTVDGKLARVTLTSSKIGNVFDHGIDLVHPPFWYMAWYFGIAAGATQGQTLLLAGAAWTTVIGYVIGRLQEGFFLWRYRIELHAWRPIDSAFRLFTARRNPNLAIMTAAVIAGRPDVGLLAVAVWTVVSLTFHFLRIGQAIQAERRGARIESWLAEPAPSS